MILRVMISRRWLLATLLVIAATAVMIRLGFWQLDRLEQRRAFNARVVAQVEGDQLDLNRILENGGEAELRGELFDMEYRSVIVEGEYDHSQEVILRNQAWENQLGVRLITPLKIAGTGQAILVDRGWVPYEDYTQGDLDQYQEPGIVRVEGIVRRSQTRPDIGRMSDPTPEPGGGRMDAFYLANVERISSQVSYPLLPAYIQQSEDPARTALPYSSAPLPQITEGSHLGYAIQWFTFAAILFFGYPFFVRRETQADG